MLFMVKSLKEEINLDQICSIGIKANGKDYRVNLANCTDVEASAEEYQEIKKYFDAKNMKNVFVEHGIKEDVPVVKLPFISTKPSIDLMAYRHVMMPPVHDQQYSGHLLRKEEIEKQSLENRSKDVVDSMASAIKAKTDREYRLEAMEKIRSENADCKKCANNSEGCEACLVYHNGKHHFTNLRITAESMGKYVREAQKETSKIISFSSELNESETIRGVLEMLKMEGVIKAYSRYDRIDHSRFTITKA